MKTKMQAGGKAAFALFAVLALALTAFVGVGVAKPNTAYAETIAAADTTATEIGEISFDSEGETRARMSGSSIGGEFTLYSSDAEHKGYATARFFRWVPSLASTGNPWTTPSDNEPYSGRNTYKVEYAFRASAGYQFTYPLKLNLSGTEITVPRAEDRAYSYTYYIPGGNLIDTSSQFVDYPNGRLQNLKNEYLICSDKTDPDGSAIALVTVDGGKVYSFGNLLPEEGNLTLYYKLVSFYDSVGRPCKTLGTPEWQTLRLPERPAAPKAGDAIHSGNQVGSAYEFLRDGVWVSGGSGVTIEYDTDVSVRKKATTGSFASRAVTVNLPSKLWIEGSDYNKNVGDSLPLAGETFKMKSDGGNFNLSKWAADLNAMLNLPEGIIVAGVNYDGANQSTLVVTIRGDFNAAYADRLRLNLEGRNASEYFTNRSAWPTEIGEGFIIRVKGAGSYTVEHYLQTLTGAYGSANEIELINGNAGEQTNARAKTFEGFTAPQTIQQLEIADNGNTTVRIYYTRNRYTITYVTGGTPYTVDAQYGAATPAYSGNTPTKAQDNFNSYAFKDFGTVAETVTGDATYTAVFTATPRVYGISFVLNGGAFAAGYPTEYTAGEGLTLPTNVTKPNKGLDGWYENADFSGNKVTAISADDYGDKTYYAKWVDGYNVNFDANGHGTAPGAILVVPPATTLSALPQNPAAVGYTFGGWWSKNGSAGDWGEQLSVNTTVTVSVTYYAKWIPNADTAYTVKHFKENLDGTYAETPDDTDSLTGTTDAATNAQAKTYEGFTAGTVTQKKIAADGSAVVEIRYTRNSYNVTYKNGDTVLQGPASVKYGAATPAYTGETPTKAEDDFYTYLFKDFGAVAETVTGDTIYQAQFTATAKVYTLTLNAGAGTLTNAPTRYTAASATALPVPTAPVGQKFVGWFGNAELAGDGVTEIAATVFGNKTYWAKYAPIVVTLDLGGETKNAELNADGKIAKPEVPVKDGYTFAGWYKDAECTEAWNFETDTVTADTTLYAKWEKDGLSGGAIAGITIGTILGALIVLYVLGFFLFFHKGKLNGKFFAAIYTPMNKLFKK